MSDTPMDPANPKHSGAMLATPAPMNAQQDIGHGSPPESWRKHLLELAEKHAEPAHDEEEYYNPPPRANPWEGMGYFWFALTASVAGWVVAQWVI
jgi:hypothetical protein